MSKRRITLIVGLRSGRPAAWQLPWQSTTSPPFRGLIGRETAWVLASYR